MSAPGSITLAASCYGLGHFAKPTGNLSCFVIVSFITADTAQEQQPIVEVSVEVLLPLHVARIRFIHICSWVKRPFVKQGLLVLFKPAGSRLRPCFCPNSCRIDLCTVGDKMDIGPGRTSCRGSRFSGLSWTHVRARMWQFRLGIAGYP